MKNLLLYLAISLATFGFQVYSSHSATKANNIVSSNIYSTAKAKSEFKTVNKVPSKGDNQYKSPARALEKITYYTNTYGEDTQSPTHYSGVPSGASAICYDGTYSFSRNRRGTCSRHGGVKKWL